MTDPRYRVSRSFAMLCVVLLLTLAFAPTTLAAPADDDRPSISFEFVLNVFAGLMQHTIDAISNVHDPNGAPAPAPPPMPPIPTADDFNPDNPGDDGGEASPTQDANG